MSVSCIAHRCGTDRYPELTLAAAKHSLEIGAEYVEMDIRFTKDNIPVIAHDKDAQRLYGVPAKIRDMTCMEFLALRHLSAPQYGTHTLDEVLASGVGYILFHIKEGKERLPLILKKIQEHRLENKIVMGLLSYDEIRTVKATLPDCKVLAFMPSVDYQALMIEAGADVIRLWEDWVTPSSVAGIKKAGKQVWIMAGSSEKGTTGYTSDEKLQAFLEMGADGFLINEVEKLNQLRKRFLG